LLNDRILKIAGGIELLDKAGIPHQMVNKAGLSDIILALQNEYVLDSNFHINQPEKAAALVWVLNSKSKANTAVFVPTSTKVKSPSQIGYRLANTDLTILGAFNSLQEQGRLNGNMINDVIWSKIPA
jgi:hypothetical protein